MTEKHHISVAIPVPLNTLFTYSVPSQLLELVSVGKRVLVPFGRRTVTGYVMGNTKDPGNMRIRDILDVMDETALFPQEMVPFFKWISDYYLYPVGETIKCALPGGINVSDATTFEVTDKGRSAISEIETEPMTERILKLLDGGPLPKKQIASRLKARITAGTLLSMERSGLVAKNRTLAGNRTRIKTERHVELSGKSDDISGLSEIRRMILATLGDTGEIAISDLKKIYPTAPQIVKKLEEQGLVNITQKQVYRNPFGESIEPDTPPKLTQEQQSVVDSVTKRIGEGFSPFMLAGVTGSGKTEVYMTIVAKAVEKNRTALVLVPEISLISQTEHRFRARFGECIAVLHSGLSGGERYDQWLRIARGEVNIVIGARSSIFAPLKDLGVIIVDEEHDSSYKQDSTLRYNARDLSMVRGKQADCPVLLGSATPSLQSWYNVTNGRFEEVRLTQRVNKRPLPEIELVDLKKYRDTRGIRKFITQELIEAMGETLERGEQVLLFLNRRGFSNHSVCGFCGEAIKCKDCDISMTLHKSTRAFKCHQCGFMMSAVTACPTCGSDNIQNLGIGTEKLEEAVKALFPESSVARLDNDTTVKKGSMVKILKSLQNRETDILIGTQMVAKGHDFPHITLVGILCADTSLNFPDFRASEQTFQLLAQVSGRAGRGEKPGRVIMQTYNPDHFSILAAQTQDFFQFYNMEIGFRKSLMYPPFSRMVQIRISGKDKNRTRITADSTGLSIRKILGGDPAFGGKVQMLGPAQAALAKIAGNHRWQILLKSTSAQVLNALLRKVFFEGDQKKPTGEVSVTIDIDPFFML